MVHRAASMRALGFLRAARDPACGRARVCMGEWVGAIASTRMLSAKFSAMNKYLSCTLATRYDKTARNDSAMVAIACIVVWLKVWCGWPRAARKLDLP